jgi:hypothetical protein
LDHSPKGICLYYYGCTASQGDVLFVHPAAAPGTFPWVEVLVKNRRPKRSRVELGCEISQAASAACSWCAASRLARLM